MDFACIRSFIVQRTIHARNILAKQPMCYEMTMPNYNDTLCSAGKLAPAVDFTFAGAQSYNSKPEEQSWFWLPSGLKRDSAKLSTSPRRR